MFYVDLKEHAPRGRIFQVAYLGIVPALDFEDAKRIAQERYQHRIENCAQYLAVTRVHREPQQ